MEKIIVIAGPTASGKSNLAVALARKYHGEIISADSRQIYRGLDIGSGKITTEEMRDIPHHLLDVASPKRAFTVARYQQLGRKALRGIIRRGRLPIICGGTGLYIQTLINDSPLPNVKPNQKLRRALEKQSTNDLWEQLNRLDPTRARNIDRHNPRRLIRALEIVRALGRVPPLNKGSRPKFEILYLVLNPPARILRQKINRRLQQRLKNGLVEEVIKLKRNGLSWQRLNDLGLEYRYVADFLKRQPNNFRGASQIGAWREILELAIWHYARRQLTWFRKIPDARWVSNTTEAKKLVSDFLR